MKCVATSFSAACAALEERCVPPKRCRTAYNIFYQAERNRIIASIPDRPKSSSSSSSASSSSSSAPSSASRRSKGGRPVPHGKIGFLDLARKISTAWKNLSDQERSHYIEIARVDKKRYLQEKEAWKSSVAELERIHSSDEPLPTKSSSSIRMKMMPKHKSTSSTTKMKNLFPSSAQGLTLRISHAAGSSRNARLPSLDIAEAMEPTPIRHDVATDPHFPLPYSCFMENLNSVVINDTDPYSALEVQSLHCVARQLDSASLKFIIERLS